MVAGIVGLLGIVGLVAVCCLVVRLSTFVRTRHDQAADRDFPSALLRLVCRRLPEGRSDWGQALDSELAAISGRRARWSFALGGIWSTVASPLGGRLDRPSLAFLLGSAVVSVGLVITGLAAHPGLFADPQIPLFLAVVLIVLAGYALGGLADSRRREHAVSWPNHSGRWTLVTGVSLGLVWTVFAAGWLDLRGWPLILAVVLPALTGAGPGRGNGGWRAGFASVRGVVPIAGLSAFIGTVLEALTEASGPFAPDQLNEATARGYSDAGSYWMGEGLVTALLLLFLIPCFTIVCGMAGAMIGQISRPRVRGETTPS